MGLPLFVATVESDLPSKSASKHSATSPPRTSIRRSRSRDARGGDARRGGSRLYANPTLLANAAAAHTSQQEPATRIGTIRRNAVRLHGNELVFPTGPDTVTPWGDPPQPPSSFLPVHVHDVNPRTARDTTEGASPYGERRRERLQEMLHASLRSLDSSREGGDRPAEYLGWFSTEPETHQPDASSRRRHAHLLRFMTPQLPAISDLRNDPPPAAGSGRESSTERSGDRANARHPERRARTNPQTRLARFNMIRRGQTSRRGVDGLGDRDRSLSPEVWDTLLSTLTPDPQPPSASSSFASAAASQTAAPSSITTPPTVDADMAADGPCDSGCENSDGEDEMYRSASRRSQSALRRDNEIQEYNLDGAADGPASRSSRQGSARRTAGPDGPIGSSRQGSADDTTGRARGALPLSHLLHPAPRDGWVGRLSVGASDEEHGDDDAPRDREGSTSQNASGNDEDIRGMRRIIRSLSQRQDIPEEWWAEAGLRRTLPPDTEFP